MKVCIIGSGYVGLVTGICFAANDKHDVVFFDTNFKKIISSKYMFSLKSFHEKNVR